MSLVVDTTITLDRVIQKWRSPFCQREYPSVPLFRYMYSSPRRLSMWLWMPWFNLPCVLWMDLLPLSFPSLCILMWTKKEVFALCSGGRRKCHRIGSHSPETFISRFRGWKRLRSKSTNEKVPCVQSVLRYYDFHFLVFPHFSIPHYSIFLECYRNIHTSSGIIWIPILQKWWIQCRPRGVWSYLPP